MKTIKQIREASGGKEAYQKFFNSLLKKYGVKSPSELDDKQKKKFYQIQSYGRRLMRGLSLFRCLGFYKI